MKILNETNKFLENLNAMLVNVVITLMGIILIFTALVIKTDTFWGQICISVGTSFLASSIVVFISSKYMFKQSRVKEMIEDWGIGGIYETRQSMNQFSNSNLERNEIQLDIVAFGLRSFRHAKSNLIEDKIRKGMKLRILTMHPDSMFLKERENIEGCIEGEIKNTIIQLIDWMEELKKIQIEEAQVQIRFYDTLPLDFYFGLDDAIYVGPYLYGIDSQQTISYEYRTNTKGYHYYSRYFEKLWNNEKLCKEISR